MRHEEWVRLVGYRNANRLFLRYGGRSIHIPKRIKEKHPLLVMLGFDAMSNLCKEHASELLFVPRMNRAINDFRVALGLKNGQKPSALLRKVKKDNDTEQLRLFP